MKLDEFVKVALLDITNGVVSAQKETLLYIAPGYINGKKIDKAHKVKFEVTVTISKEGGGGIKVLSLADLKGSAKSESTNKLSFEVPVYLNAPTPLNELHYTNCLPKSGEEKPK